MTETVLPLMLKRSQMKRLKKK